MNASIPFKSIASLRVSSKVPILRAMLLVSVLLIRLASQQVNAQTTMGSSFSGFTATTIGPAGDVPIRYGGLTFRYNDRNKLLIGGNANENTAAIYDNDVIRDAQGHITGFANTTQVYRANDPTGGGIDGGLAYGPNNVLFYTSFPGNYLGQILPGGTGPAKDLSLSPLAGWVLANPRDQSVGSLVFVPAGFPGAGRLKIASYGDGVFYDCTLVSDGFGTYDVTIASSFSIGVPGLEGMLYIKGGCNPAFLTNAILIISFDKQVINAYDIDNLGNPILATQRLFASGESYAGATIDPVTGDFLFVTWGAMNKVIRINGMGCLACDAGKIVPALSTVSVQNICPSTTIDLTPITASNAPANTTLTWHTGTPATDSNKLSTLTGLAPDTHYYAAFFDATNACYSGNGGSATTDVRATSTVCVTPCLVLAGRLAK